MNTQALTNVNGSLKCVCSTFESVISVSSFVLLDLCECCFFDCLDEEKRPVLKKTESRSRENSNPALTPPRDVDTATVNFADQIAGRARKNSKDDVLRAALTASFNASGRQSADQTASGGGDGSTPSQAEKLLYNLRKQGIATSLGADAPNTML